MTKGLVWIPNKVSNYVEILISFADRWLVELPYDFQEEFSPERRRDLRVSSVSDSSASSASGLAIKRSLSPNQDAAVISYGKTIDPSLEQQFRWENEARLVFSTPPNLGNERVAFWEIDDQNLARKVFWTTAIGNSGNLVSCILSGDCDQSLLENLAYEVKAKRGFVNGGMLFDDAWIRIAASCRLGLWFGRPDWDFPKSVLLTSADPSVLENILLSSVAAGAKEVTEFDDALAVWRNDCDGNCVCWVDIETELARCP